MASADVNYALAAARNLSFAPSMLERYGAVDGNEFGFEFESLTAYSIRGVDPQHASVIKLKPGQGGDSGPLGDYFLLIRGPDTFSELCPFLDKSSEATPRVCR